MRTLILTTFAAIALSIAPTAGALESGETAQNWTLNDAAGQPVDFYEDSAGSVAVVMFWMTTCPYCRELMPTVQKLADEFSGRPVKFYAMNVWETGDAAGYLSTHGYTFRLLPGAEAIARDSGVAGTPGLFVIGPDHKVLYKRQAGEDELDVEIGVRDAIESALAPVVGRRVD